MSRNLSIADGFRSISIPIFRVTVILCSLLLVTTIQGSAGQTQEQQQQQQQQQQQFMDIQNQFQKDPRNSEARFRLAWAVITGQGINDKVTSFLESVFDGGVVDRKLDDIDNLKGFLAAHMIGRFAKEQKDSRKAQKYTTLAYNISKRMSPDKDVGEFCTQMQLATELDFYPRSNQDVDDSVANMERWANLLIDLATVQKHKDVYINKKWLSQVMPGFANDPYVHCMLSLFPLSFYYRADVAKIANLYYQIGILAFPELLYTAQHVEEFDRKQKQHQRRLALAEGNALTKLYSEELTPPPLVQTCVDRKIKLGVIGTTFTEGHSVSEDFGGVLQRLDRSVFDVTYSYVHEGVLGTGEPARFITANPTDELVNYRKTDADNTDAAWVRRIGKEIEAFEYDIVFYPELTMATYVRRLGMERLAPVQINSHGHPLTSGIPRSTIQHFVSWAEAELPIEESQSHYTEELQLIPKGKIHQYYAPRTGTTSDGSRYSKMDGMNFDHLTRNDFPELPHYIRNSSPEDEDLHLYVCMQKPFKVFPEFDELLCGVLRDDPKGHAILHKETQTGHTTIFEERLTAAGCDMARVHFLSPQPPHLLMALYQTATVILDSYPAGGCTTSREAMELGKAIVTWPARLLGGRWTLGLYNTIGLDEGTKARVIADSRDGYIAKAVELGTNPALRKDVENRILEAIPNLFGRWEAVEEWEKILLRVSPVKHCKDNDVKSGSDGKDEL